MKIGVHLPKLSQKLGRVPVFWPTLYLRTSQKAYVTYNLNEISKFFQTEGLTCVKVTVSAMYKSGNSRQLCTTLTLLLYTQLGSDIWPTEFHHFR